MSHRKSTTCTGKISGKPLTEYDSEFDARQGADYARYAHAKDVSPYRCPRCSKWHLAPTSRQTPSTTCYSCTGKDGRPKAAYATEQDAERRAEILAAEQGVHLRAYACDLGDGWHLTKA